MAYQQEKTEARTAQPQRPPAAPFTYARAEFDAGKQVVMLARTDRMMATVQILQEGGENNLHSHPHQDGFWMVLKGAARFYGEDDALIAEVGVNEGVLIPRGTRYWFEKVGPDALELLQVEAFDKPMRAAREVAEDRVDHMPRLRAAGDTVVHDGRWRR